MTSPVSPPRRIAVVHDWLDTWRGGENVLAEVLDLYPQAELFALVDYLPDELRERIGGRHARTSFLQRVPGAQRRFRVLLPAFPRAIESLDLRGFDLVLSISHAVAKGVKPAPGALHLCYCLTPMRYAWDLRSAYLDTVGAGRGWRRRIADKVLDRLRAWDAKSSARVDRFAAISSYIAARIRANYGRDAQVLYPPVDTAYFTPGEAPRGDAYFTASRWVPYKRVDAIAAAFRELPDRRLIVAGDGPESARVRAAAGGNVEFVGEVPRERLRELMRGARAFLFAAEEDFGIVPLEAQACGTPVIAYGRGGAFETLRAAAGPGRSACHFSEQSPEAIAAAVRSFEALPAAIDPAACRANAERFAEVRFRAGFTDFVDSAWRAHAGGR